MSTRQKISSWDDFKDFCNKSNAPKLSALSGEDRSIAECIFNAIAAEKFGWSTLSKKNHIVFGDERRTLGGLKTSKYQNSGPCMYWNRRTFSQFEPVGINWLSESRENNEALWRIESAYKFAEAIRNFGAMQDDILNMTPPNFISPVSADPKDTATDWAEKHRRHHILRGQNSGLHDLLHALSKHILDRRTDEKMRLQLESPNDEQAAWSMGQPSELGSFHLYAIFQQRHPRITCCCVVELDDLPEIIDSSTSLPQLFKQDQKRHAFKNLIKYGLRAISFSITSFEEALPRLSVLTNLGYLLPDGIALADANKAKIIANQKAKRRRVVMDEVSRSSTVRADVLRAAKGLCALCSKRARFKTADDEDFLHVHHIVELSGIGEDRFENCVALHADCHAEAHYAPTDRREAIKLALQKYRQAHPATM